MAMYHGYTAHVTILNHSINRSSVLSLESKVCFNSCKYAIKDKMHRTCTVISSGFSGNVVSISDYCLSRSQWPRGLRRRSGAARLLILWVRTPPRGHGCLSVLSVVCCQVEVSGTSWSFVQRNPTDCGASLCVIWKTSWMRNHTQSMWFTLI